MGGNALKNIKVNEITNIENLKRDVRGKLVSLGFNDFKFPEFYKEKKSHGDLDVIIAIEENILSEIIKNNNNGKPLEFALKILRVFSSKDYFFNTNTFSIEYQNHQIDLIFTKHKYLESTYNYLSWSDLGNFIGRTSDKMGLKFGERGLLYENSYFEIELSQNIEDILFFLGYDYEIWKNGFDSIIDIFNFCISSKYFNVNIFYEQNHKNRKRNAKRKTWNAFIDYLQDNNIQKNFDFNSEEYYILKALISFNKEREYLENLLKIEKKKNVKEKYNGKIIQEILPTLKQENLTDFKNKFESSFLAFEHMVLESNKNEIRNLIQKFGEKYE